jgi:hypothetical protein
MVNDVLARTLPELAEMVVVPSATAVAKPPLSMVAIFVAEDAQVTNVVASPVVLFPKVAVAVYCWVALGIMTEFSGDICSETIWSAGGKNCPQATNMMIPTEASRVNGMMNFECCTRIMLSPKADSDRVRRRTAAGENREHRYSRWLSARSRITAAFVESPGSLCLSK